MSRSGGATVGDVALADPHRPRRHLLEPGDHPQQRRLAAARGPDQHHELARRDLQRDVVDRADRAVVDLRDALERDRARSSLHRARGQRADERLLREQERDARTGSVDDHVARHHRRPLRAVRALEGRQPELQRVVATSELIAISGQVRSFQTPGTSAPRPCSAPAAPAAARSCTSDRAAASSRRSTPPPRSRAAATTKNWRSRKTPNGVTSDGRISAPEACRSARATSSAGTSGSS